VIKNAFFSNNCRLRPLSKAEDDNRDPAATFSLQEPVALRCAKIAESWARRDSKSSSFSVTDFWFKLSKIDCLYVIYKLKTKDRKQSSKRTSSLTTISSKSQQKVIKTVKMAKFKYLPIDEKNWQRLLWEKVEPSKVKHKTPKYIRVTKYLLLQFRSTYSKFERVNILKGDSVKTCYATVSFFTYKENFKFEKLIQRGF
jgi:hypothetical protein